MMAHISGDLELESEYAVRLVTPTWKENCSKRPVRVRCDANTEVAQHVLNRIQYAKTFFHERTHLVVPAASVSSWDES